MAPKWRAGLLRCAMFKLFSCEQTSAIEEELRQSPEMQEDAEQYMAEWAETDAPPSILVEHFRMLLGRKRRAVEGQPEARLLRDVRPLSLPELQMPSLDMAFLREVAVPVGSDYSLGRLTSVLVEWSSESLDLTVLQQWWEQNVLCEDVILPDESHTNILEHLKQKHLQVEIVDETKRKKVVRRQYKKFIRVVKTCMEVIVRRLGIQCELKATYDQQVALPSPQFLDGLLWIDGKPWIAAEGKSHGEDAAAMEHKMAEARGELVRLANQRFLASYDAIQVTRGSPFSATARGFTFTGKDVQAVILTHAVVRKPRGFATPLAPLGVFVGGDCYEVDVHSKGMEVILQQCLSAAVGELKMRARAEEAESYWRRGKLVALKEKPGFMIGDKLLEVTTGKSSGLELEVEVKSVVRATPTSIVVSVLWKGETWWMKLGPNRSERRWEMTQPDCYWEAWFQVERDGVCHLLVGSDLVVIPVEVEGVDRPALLIQDAGVSLSEMKGSMTPIQVSEMSEQVFEALNKAGGVFHNDVAPRNICFKDGKYRLIDWGFACGPKLRRLERAVGQAWKTVSLVVPLPPVLDWKLSPDCCLFNVPPWRVRDHMEGLFYCCLELLNQTLPWSDAAAAEDRAEVLRHRWETKRGVRNDRSFMNASFIFQPVLDHVLNWPEAPKPDSVDNAAASEPPMTEKHGSRKRKASRKKSLDSSINSRVLNHIQLTNG